MSVNGYEFVTMRSRGISDVMLIENGCEFVTMRSRGTTDVMLSENEMPGLRSKREQASPSKNLLLPKLHGDGDRAAPANECLLHAEGRQLTVRKRRCKVIK